MIRFASCLLLIIFSAQLAFSTQKLDCDRDSLAVSTNLNYSFEFENKNKVQNGVSYKNFLLPASLITYGMIAQTWNPLDKIDKNIKKEVARHNLKTRSFDDYILYMPGVATLGLDWLGVEARHNFRDRALVLGTSLVVNQALTESLKRAYGTSRPDGSDHRSFPSSHTSVAFTQAHVFFREYGHHSPWIGVGGYAIATTTAVMRVLNNRHWASDVVAGAGIGILSAELGYVLLPVWHRVLGIKESKESFALMPTISNKGGGISLVYNF